MIDRSPARLRLSQAMLMMGTALMLGLAAPVPARAPAPGAVDRTMRLDSDNLNRSYELHVPAGPAPAGGFPVILAFHGGGGRGETMAHLTRLDDLADARSFIAIYPDGVDKHWNDGRSTIKNPVDDVGFVARLLDQVAHAYPVNTRRVYATGISNGALFAERLGCEMAGRIAGIAAIAGTMPDDLASSCRPSHHVGVLQIDGTADPIMPYDGGGVADFGGRGEGGHVLSVRDTLAFWARRNDCGRPEQRIPLQTVQPWDRTRVSRTAFVGCVKDGPVELLAIEGGGHAWPGGPQYAPAFIIGKASHQIDASLAVVDFFLAIPSR